MASLPFFMSKNVMPSTGYIPKTTRSLLESVRLDVIFARGEWLDATWCYDLCSPFWRLYVNGQAGAELELDGRRMALRPGTVYLLPAGLRFKTRLARGVKRVWQDFIHFEVDGFPPALLRRLFPAPLPLSPSKDIEVLLAACREADADPKADEMSRRFRRLALAHAAMAAAFGQATAEGRESWHAWLRLPPVVAPALRLLEERLGSPPANEELARACGLGVRQFLRRFSESVGLSPGQFALERRVALAAEALARGDDTMETITERLGFADRFHFSKVFKARVGLPPVAYRRMHAGDPRADTT